jgi:uncharacterized protein (TIGR01777 family)
MTTFRQSTKIAVEAAALERWHLESAAFRRLTPPWERLEVVEQPSEIRDGARVVVRMKIGLFWWTWVAEHQDCRPGVGFSDVQVQGPFADWKHVHRFCGEGHRVSELSDEIAYRLPFGFAGNLLGAGLVKGKLERVFNYRHAVTKMDLERLASEPQGDGRSMQVLVTGGTGMVGEALESFLSMRGHRVRRVTRNCSREGDVHWDPEAGILDLGEDEPVDAVVHLAGENIAGGRWNKKRKGRILESRREGTRLLCETMAQRRQPPGVIVSASGANYYATATERPQDESAAGGEGFLAEVCQAWEGGTAVAERAGIRVVKLRLGVVLSPAGGVLAKMLPVFKMGLGGRLGSGTQRMPWIALDDVIDIIHRALRDERYAGAVNAVAPEVVENGKFTRELAQALRRPAAMPVPASLLKLVLGRQMAEETLLVDLHLEPGKLRELAYPFRFPQIEGALGYLLGISTPSDF